MLYVILLLYSLLIAYEFVPLYKQKYKVDLWVNIGIGIVSLTMAILLCLDIRIPSPATPIREFITSIFGK